MTFRDEVLKAAREAGWIIKDGRKHTLLFPDDGGRPIPISKSRRTKRGRMEGNSRSALRKRGLDV
jgi:hypothetical protein